MARPGKRDFLVLLRLLPLSGISELSIRVCMPNTNYLPGRHAGIVSEGAERLVRSMGTLCI